MTLRSVKHTRYEGGGGRKKKNQTALKSHVSHAQTSANRQLRPQLARTLTSAQECVSNGATTSAFGVRLPWSNFYLLLIEDRRRRHTFEESLNGFVDAVLKMLQHQHNLVVTFVGHDSPDSTDLQKTETRVLLDQSEDTLMHWLQLLLLV